MTRSTTLSVTATALALLSPFAANLNNGYVPSPFAVSAFTAPSSLSSLSSLSSSSSSSSSSSRHRSSLYLSSSTTTTTTETSSGNNNDNINYNAVYVAKEGGVGVKSASEMMGSRGVGNTRSLGAPPSRPPRGGTFVTKGGVTIDAIVRPLRYTHGEYDVCVGLDEDDDDCEGYVSSFFQNNSNNNGSAEESSNGLVWGSDGAIERLVDLLDHRRGALLTSSYEFPGR